MTEPGAPTIAGMIRTLAPHDRAAVAAIVRDVGNFSAAEIDTALELVDEWLTDGEASGYLCLVVEDFSGIHGYVCVGPTPLTDGTFDLYWIAVDRNTQGRGYGRSLLAAAEAVARERGGRLML